MKFFSNKRVKQQRQLAPSRNAPIRTNTPASANVHRSRHDHLLIGMSVNGDDICNSTEVSSVTNDVYFDQRHYNCHRLDINQEHPNAFADLQYDNLRSLYGSIVEGYATTSFQNLQQNNLVATKTSNNHPYELSTNSSHRSTFGLAGSKLMKMLGSREWGEVLASTANRITFAREAATWGKAPLYEPDPKSTQKALPLHLACTLRPPKEIVDHLLTSFPAGAAAPDPKEGKLPIHLAIIRGASVEVVRALCDAYPAGLRTRDNEGRFPIHYACIWRDRSIVQVLLQVYPAGIRAIDANERSPLDLVKMSGNSKKDEVMKLLLEWLPENNADSNKNISKNKSGPGALDSGIGDGAALSPIAESLCAGNEPARIKACEYTKEVAAVSDSDENMPGRNISAPSYASSRSSSGGVENSGKGENSQHIRLNTSTENTSLSEANTNIDNILSHLMKGRQQILIDKNDLSRISDQMESIRRRDEQVKKGKSLVQAKLDARMKTIDGHNTVIEDTLKKIEEMKLIIANEQKKISIEQAKYDKDKVKFEDHLRLEEEVAEQMHSLEIEKQNVENVLEEKMKTLEEFDGRLQQLT